MMPFFPLFKIRTVRRESSWSLHFRDSLDPQGKDKTSALLSSRPGTADSTQTLLFYHPAQGLQTALRLCSSIIPPRDCRQHSDSALLSSRPGTADSTQTLLFYHPAQGLQTALRLCSSIITPRDCRQHSDSALLSSRPGTADSTQTRLKPRSSRWPDKQNKKQL